MEAGAAVGDYVCSRCIGRGSFATVWKAKHRGTGQVVALKDVDRTKLSEKLEKNLELEIGIMRKLNHPHVVSLIDVFASETNLVIVLEYCNHGDLFKHITKQKKALTEAQSKSFIQQLATGMRYVRQHGVIHRDLKPQNLLLVQGANRSLSLKIADFGFARFFEPQSLVDTLCGSPLYMAPEVLAMKRYGEKADGERDPISPHLVLRVYC